MKLTKILATGLLSLALAPLANADVTINITGSTAFRAVTHQAILNVITPAGRVSTREGTSDTPSKTGMKDVQRACFKGSVSGISGVTTVNCNWNGSVEGMTIVGAGVPTSGWINPATATFAADNGTGNGHLYTNGTAPLTSATPNIACSDVFQSATTVTADLEDVDNGVAVIPFRWVASESAPLAMTNMTDQLHEALYVQGSQQQSLFTGNPADTNLVYAVGRDAGSGTRTTRLAETRYGIVKPVTQWRVTGASGVASDVRLWPSQVEEPVPGSTAFFNDPTQLGNGGYTSGGFIATIMGYQSTSVNIRGPDNTLIVGGQNVCFVAHLGLSDAASAIAAGGKAMTYNGGTYTKNNVREGSFTDWGYLHILNQTGALSVDQTTARDAIIANFTGDVPGTTLYPFGASIESGIEKATMNVSRSEDGGLVGP